MLKNTHRFEVEELFKPNGFMAKSVWHGESEEDVRRMYDEQTGASWVILSVRRLGNNEAY
jgi:hypothetical protein